MTVYLFATLDTKGPEAAFVRDELRRRGVACVVVDTGCLLGGDFAGDITPEDVFAAAGTSHAAMLQLADRGTAVTKAAAGAAEIARLAFAAGKLTGVIGLGGSAGTLIGTAAMRVLPLGVPKVMVSTLASGNVRQWVGNKDIFMLNTIVDIAGLNRLSRPIFLQAAAAMCGLLTLPALESSAANDRPLIAATMFGVTTACVQRARAELEAAGYEVVVFHATGNGGEALESLIREGMFVGVLDITTTELADELVGGILSAGPTRLTAAAEMGIPQVVSVGALDMVNFGPRESVLAKFADRKFYLHNAVVTLMRTTAEENKTLGAEIGRKLSAATGPMAILLPEQGISAIDRTGQPFEDAVAREALFAAIEQSAPKNSVTRLPYHINDEPFAVAAATKLLEMLRI